MSIASISSAFVGLVRHGSAASALAAPPAAPVDGVDATDRAAPRRGQRHELVDAMAGVLGLDASERSPAADQAVFRFAHALMHDLRAVAGPADDGPGRGRAWGRQGWSDLGERLSALATAVAAGSPGSGGTPPAAAPAPSTGSGTLGVPTADARASATASTAATPDAAATPSAAAAMRTAAAAPAPASGTELAPPQPLTQTSAALWLSQVPSARLLEAFANLSQALPSDEAAAGGGERGALSALLDKLASAVAPSAVPEPGAGSLFHATA